MHNSRAIEMIINQIFIKLSLSILPFQNIARKLYVPAAQSALNMLHVDIIVLPAQILEAILLGLSLLVAA